MVTYLEKEGDSGDHSCSDNEPSDHSAVRIYLTEVDDKVIRVYFTRGRAESLPTTKSSSRIQQQIWY